MVIHLHLYAFITVQQVNKTYLKVLNILFDIS